MPRNKANTVQYINWHSVRKNWFITGLFYWIAVHSIVQAYLTKGETQTSIRFSHESNMYH